MKHKHLALSMKAMTILVTQAMLFVSVSSYSTPSACNLTSKYYNILTLQCTDCPTNTQQATDNTFCNCTNSYFPSWNVIGFNYASSCQALNTVNLSQSQTYNKSSQVLSLYDQSGNVTPVVVSCASNSYPKFSENRCVSCGYDSQLVYNSTLKACQCATGYTKIGETCYQNKITWSRNFSSTDTFNYLAEEYVKIGCQQQNLPQPCNMLINMCVRVEYSSSNFFCNLLSTLSSQSKSELPVYKFSAKLTDSIGIFASSKIGINTTTIKNQLNIISVQYDVYGSIKQIAPIDKELFECDVTDGDVISFSSFGLNLFKQCTTKRTFSSESYYDFFVQTTDGKLAQIPVLIQGSYYKRISPSTASGSHTFQLQFISQPPLQVPILSVTSASSPSVDTVSNSSQAGISWIVPFVIVNIGILIVFIILVYRYFQYNPSDDPNDQFFLCKGLVSIIIKLLYTWSYGLWIWLLGFTLYIFSFYKFQQTIYLILPSQQTQSSFYQIFMIIYYAEMILMVVSLWIVIYSLGDVDYFLIDWEKEKDVGKFDVNRQKKEVSVWRRVLLVNQLYELAVRKNINIYFVTLFSLLFLNGLSWINLSFSVPFTTGLTQLTSTTTSSNPILAYFIITFIYFIIAVLQFIIRHLLKIWFPLPAEDFVDLCTMTNISILIFNEYLHGYYIHGVHPLGKSEGNLQYIESTFQKEAKSFGKGRGFKTQDTEACQTFQAIFPFAIRRNFLMKYKAPMLQKMVPKNYQNQSIFSNPLPDDWDDSDYDQVDQISLSMTENFKMYLETVKASLRNVQDRSWWTKFISFPISQDVVGNVPIFLKDKWNDFTNAFLSGHEFLFLFNFINLVNLGYIITSNIYFGSLLAVIVNQLAFNMPANFLMKRNLSKNTFIEEKFFN